MSSLCGCCSSEAEAAPSSLAIKKDAGAGAGAGPAEEQMSRAGAASAGRRSSKAPQAAASGAVTGAGGANGAGNRDVMFQPLRLGASGAVKLSHRVVLAPLTRCRASEPELAPRDMHVTYYSQRASPGGLLITEATAISPEGLGYKSVPGIWTAHQVGEWRKVTAAVHAKGGLISMQLWHVGRVSHPAFGEHPLVKDSGLPLPSVSSSAVALEGLTSVFGSAERVPNAVPRALRTDEMPRLVADYRRAARNAMSAGFDIVEVHAAHGYLLEQFLMAPNQRTDQYGGSIENRCRLLLEVVAGVVAEVGDAGRVAVRLSPPNTDAGEPREAGDFEDPDALYAHAIKALDAFGLAYLLLTEPRWFGGDDGGKGWDMPFFLPKKFRSLYKGPMFGSGGFTPINARQALDAGLYDGVAFGR
jgi:N-ethylmaleimide reductase